MKKSKKTIQKLIAKKTNIERKADSIKSVSLITDNPKDKIVEVKRRDGFFDWKNKKFKINFGFKANRNLKHKPKSSYIIEMFFSNGTCKQFVLETTEKIFYLDNNPNKAYFLYYENCYYDISLNQFRLIYHENYTVPIGRKIHVENKESPFLMIDPENLKDFIDMRYLKAIVKNPEQIDMMEFVKKYWIWILAGAGVGLYLLTNSGMA